MKYINTPVANRNIEIFNNKWILRFLFTFNTIQNRTAKVAALLSEAYKPTIKRKNIKTSVNLYFFSLKQYRKKIASQLRIAAYETITDKDLSNYIESDKNVIKLEIDIYGEATIYKVEEIDSDYSEYPLSVINKIRGEEI